LRLKRHSSQEVDVEQSYSIEDEGEIRGYYVGLIGIILKFFMGALFVLLFLAAQTAEQAVQWLVTLMFAIYVSGWIMCRQAGIKDIATYQTVTDVLGWGLFFGFVIRLVEGIVSMLAFGVFASVDRLAPFSALDATDYATGLFGDLMVMTAIALAVASVGEEMFYRGGMVYMISFLTDQYGLSDGAAKFVSLEVQAALFAVLHAAVYNQWPQILALYAGGNVLGGLFLWKKDLSVCIVAHLTLNESAMAGIMANWLVANPVYLVLALAVTMGLVILILKRRSTNYEE